MKIIAIAGNGSNSGKTTLIRVILSLYPGVFDVIKFTPSSEFGNGIEKDKFVLMQKDKDTSFFVQEGARKVVWIHGERKRLGLFLKSSLSELGNNIIIEGNSAIQYIKADLIFFVTRTLNKITKESAINVRKQADYIVLNNNSTNCCKEGNVLTVSLTESLNKPNEFRRELKKIILSVLDTHKK